MLFMSLDSKGKGRLNNRDNRRVSKEGEMEMEDYRKAFVLTLLVFVFIVVFLVAFSFAVAGC